MIYVVVIDAGSRPGGDGVARDALLRLPRRARGQFERHMRGLLHPPDVGLCRAASASTGAARGAIGAIGELRAMLEHGWALEQAAARGDARVCGYAAHRQLMLLHYLVVAFAGRDSATPASAAQALLQLRLTLRPP